jgi:glycosyltransferase involved in cell wall biosynthesis
LTIVITMEAAITVITVVKDDIDGLKATAESILAQKYHLFRWLIIDGNSSDGSWQYSKELGELPFVTSKQSAPTGIYSAMNLGAMESSTPWIWFINAGDVLLTDESLAQIALMGAANPDASIVATPVVYLTPTNHFFSISIPKVVQSQQGSYAVFHHQGCLINRLAFNQTGGFDEKLKLAADGKLLDSMILIAPPVLAPILTVGFEMGGATSKNFWRSLKEIKLYRPQSISFWEMLCYQIKELFRGVILLCLGTSLGRKILNSYLRHREKVVIKAARQFNIDLARKS